VDIRRRILKDFNKQEDDFETLREFNDYLEMVEDIIYNLTNNLEILETNKKILAYKDQHKEQIIKNRSKHSKDAIEIEDILAMENKESSQRKIELEVLEKAEKLAKVSNKEKLIDDLMFGEEDASKILAEHREKVAREERNKAAFSQETGGQEKVQEVVKVQDPAFLYVAPVLELQGPAPPEESQLEVQGFLQHVRAAGKAEEAGGYRGGIGCTRSGG
jgi:CDK-activating kinase assembly factor MAT1